jgi:hypothetical protein
MNPHPENPPTEKTTSPNPSLEDSIVGFFKVLGDSYLGSLKLQNASAELHNAMSNYHLVSDKVKLYYLRSLRRTSWLIVALLFWIALTLQFHPLSPKQSSEHEVRQSVPEDATRSYESQPAPAARNAA